jgi:4-amino-4-deoxy-L-arabinose transferase-like glycosyltransferase
MADLLGFTTIAIVSLITLLIASKWPDASKFIFAALILRILFMLAGHYIVTLPDSTQDAVGFENQAWAWAQDGFFHNLGKYPGFNSFFYPWTVSLTYSLFGRSLLMIQSIGMLFGVGSVLLGWLLAKRLWNNHVAIKVGWTLALFPSLALYSILPLREVYSSFFLLVAMFGIVNWIKFGSYKSIFLAIIGFIGAMHFHGVLIIGSFIFFLIIGLSNFKKSLKLILFKRISRQALIIIISVLILFVAYLNSDIYLPYIGRLNQITDMGWMRENIIVRMRGEASYPEWTIINSNIEIFHKGITRMAYFLFSPFIWDIQKPTHLFGFFDGILYMVLVCLIFKNRKVIWKDPALRIILIILVSYIFIFGIGTSNFGAGVRHRTKFIIEIVILAAPLIPRFIFFKKIKLRKYLNKL